MALGEEPIYLWKNLSVLMTIGMDVSAVFAGMWTNTRQARNLSEVFYDFDDQFWLIRKYYIEIWRDYDHSQRAAAACG